jgi:hypothetical protein
MFNLEHAIAEWRRQLAGGGVRSPEVLDELEGHLRDDVEDQRSRGVSVAQAFENAVQQVGQPCLLKTEFAKALGWHELPTRFYHVLLTLAGIPIPTLAHTMNTTHFEPRWATYLRAGAFLLPAILLWGLSVVFIVPKLEQICAQAGGMPLPSFVNGMVAVTEQSRWIVLAIVLLLSCLEWRSAAWPRYRRVTVGVGTFVLNSVVLIAIFLMVISALIAAPALMGGVK